MSLTLDHPEFREPDMRPRAIGVRGFTKHYGDLAAVDGVDFSVGQGEVFAFLGPNGAGKSTTIKMLCTLAHPCRCREPRPPSSCHESVLVDEAAESVALSQLGRIRIADDRPLPRYLERRPLIKGTMRTVFIVVSDEFAEHRFEVAPAEDQHPVEALTANGADEPFGGRVRTRRSNGCPDGPDARSVRLRDHQLHQGLCAELWSARLPSSRCEDTGPVGTCGPSST